jgi:hypothetical protein
MCKYRKRKEKLKKIEFMKYRRFMKNPVLYNPKYISYKPCLQAQAFRGLLALFLLRKQGKGIQ